MLAAQFEAMASFDRSTAVQNWNSPLATVILFLFHSAWTGPAETQNVWWIPAAILVLVVPFFFVSYGIEYGIVAYMVGMPERGHQNSRIQT
jgi:hypothetical protein